MRTSKFLPRVVSMACMFSFAAVDAYSAVIGAASCKRADVQAAYDKAQDGDIVTIPAGTESWARTLWVRKAITLQGAGPGQTIILDDVLEENGESGLSQGQKQAVIAVTAPTGAAVTISGIEFRGSLVKDYNGGALRLGGTTSSMRVTNCFFNELYNRSISVAGAVWGVIDNCTITSTVRNRQGIFFHQGSQYGGFFGDGAWENPVGWGGPEFMFVENCTFNMGAIYGVTDGDQGSKFVIRHNTIYNTHVGSHGTESGARARGVRAVEVYGNNYIRSLNSEISTTLGMRSGSYVAFNNTASGKFKNMMQIAAYRSFHDFPPWGMADGTFLWDENDTTDPGSGGGDAVAGDGIFESGVSESNTGPETLVDTDKSWIPDQWVRNGYILRVVVRGTATEGGVRTLKVSPSPGWEENQWRTWIVTKVSTGQKASVANSTADQINLSILSNEIDFTGGGDFVLSLASPIIGNTATTLTMDGHAGYIPDQTYLPGSKYEIRKVNRILDAPGSGITTPLLPARDHTLPHQVVNQQDEPIYQWNNYLNGTLRNIVNNDAGFMKAGRDYFNGTCRPGYTPFTFPHPLRGLPPVSQPLNCTPGDQANTPPSILKAPSNRNVEVGQTAVFSVSAAGALPLSYQWFRNGQAIVNAKNAFYETPAVSLADDGGLFACVVTNPFGSVTSTSGRLKIGGSEDSDPDSQPQPEIVESFGFLQFKNVFNPTKEKLEIKYSAKSNDVTLSVFDRVGNEVKTLDVGVPSTQGYRTTWDGRNTSNIIVASGTYVLILKEGGNVLKKKVVVVK